MRIQVAMLELPPFITPHLATSVEFIGRAVRLLRSRPASAKLRQLHADCSYNSQQQPWAAAADTHQQLLPHDDTLAFAAALRVLQQQPVISQAALERTVEAIRADVSYVRAAAVLHGRPRSSLGIGWTCRVRQHQLQQPLNLHCQVPGQ